MTIIGIAYLRKQTKKGVIFLMLTAISMALKGQTTQSLDSLNQLSKSYVCANSERFDSLSQEIIQLAEENEWHDQLGDALIIKAYGQMCIGENEKALSMLKNALVQFKKTNNQKGIATAYHHMTSAALRLSRIDSAFLFARLELGVARATTDTILLAACYLSLSGIHTNISQNDSIIYYSIKGLEVLGKVDNDKLRGSFNVSIGNAYYQNENFPEAIKYFSRGKKYFSEESLNMGNIYHNLGTVFTRIGAYDSSFYYLNKTIEINKKMNRKASLAYNYQALAHNYAQSGDCSKSIEYNLMSIKLSEEMGEKRSLAGVYTNLSECYIKIGDLNKAEKSVLKALLLTQENGDVDKQADVYFMLSEVYKAQGKYQQALEAHKNFYSLDSLLLGKDKQETISNLEIKYETEKKEAEIATLSQQAAIQELKIAQRNQTIIIGLVGFVLLFIVVYFIYRERSIKRDRIQTELEHRFLRSQLNPHFIFNALLAIQNFMLKNDGKAAALYLTKFSKLMRQILESSREEFIPVEEEVEMLKNYMDIHQLRLQNSFSYSIDIADNIDPETDTIPPMFVQPFVENAIEHGIVNAKGKGLIELSLKKIAGYITIEIKDNGGGLSGGSSNPKEHHSLATTIIKERMELFNKTLKDQIQLVLGDIRGGNGEILGTKVELKVPFGYI